MAARPHSRAAANALAWTWRSLLTLTMKRRRYDNHMQSLTSACEPGRADTLQSPEQPLLPDSFRRSPKGKGRAVNSLPDGHVPNDTPGKHQPGSIVRIKLTDFVTYTNAEFHPGPNLNMIIGPNGTGKSTLVCAICLGLGWGTVHLGRAKDISEFVKHGSKKAAIEIELAADPTKHSQNPVITHRITREGSKSDFYINGKKETKKRVQELARSFSIQVDNLCQFLPQDRVVEFAGLSPVELLAQTQRAAASEEMVAWHEQLKSRRKEERAKEDEQQRDVEHLKSLEDRQRQAEPDVARLRERSDLQDRLAALEKLTPFPRYRVAKDKHRACQDRKKEALAELRNLEAQVAPNLRAVTEKAEYLEKVNKAVQMRQRLVQRSESNTDSLSQKQVTSEAGLKSCEKEIHAEKTIIKSKKAEKARLQQAVNNFKRAIANPPADFDPAAMNEQVRDKNIAVRQLDDQLDEIKHSIGSLAQQSEYKMQQSGRLQDEKNGLQSQAGQQASKLSSANRQACEAWKWIQSNRDKFQGEVFGPPIVECRVKNPDHADAVESMLPLGELTSFTVTNMTDFNMLSQQLYGALRLSDINIRVSAHPMSKFPAPHSTQQLQRLGLECWLLDLIEGPEPVLAMLCDNRAIHQTAFTTQELSENQYEALKREGMTSWVTPSQTYIINRRREYGDKATSTAVRALRRAKYFTDAPIDHGQETELDRRIAALKSEVLELEREVKEAKARHGELVTQRKTLAEEAKALHDEKNQKQAEGTQFRGLPVKVEIAERKQSEAEDDINACKGRVVAILERQDKLVLERGQQALDHANAVEALRGLYMQLVEAEIQAIEAKSDHEQLELRTTEERQAIEARKAEVQKLAAESKAAFDEGNRLGQLCRDIGDHMSDVETLVYDDIKNLDPAALDTEIESVKARLDMDTGGSNMDIIKEFEVRAKKIEQKRNRVEELKVKLDDLEAQIAGVREQ